MLSLLVPLTVHAGGDKSQTLAVEDDRIRVDTLSLYDAAPAGMTGHIDKAESADAGLIRDDPLRPEMAEDVVLAEGDSVEVVVFEDPSFNGVYQVRTGGYIFLPQIGSFRVGNLTAAQTEQALTERLERDLLRKATVSVIPSKPGAPVDSGGVVYVVGEVERPGVLRIPPRETLTMLTAIIRAGGIGLHGDPAQVQLARLKGGRREISIMHFDAVMAGVESGTELALQHGDIINVIGRGGISLHREPPPSRGTVYLSGQVKNPGPHPIQDLTVYRTILRNGGLDRFANLRRTYVLRVDHETGRQMKIPVDLQAVIRRGELEKDIPVEPGDIIVVPEKFFSF